MSFVDGFVLAVPTANKEEFIDYAQRIDTIFLEYGATRVMECWGADIPDGKLTDFRKAVQATEADTVAFSWIEWPDRATRDAAMAQMEKLMETDERFDMEKNPLPFDGKRMIYGGFDAVVTLVADNKE